MFTNYLWNVFDLGKWSNILSPAPWLEYVVKPEIAHEKKDIKICIVQEDPINRILNYE